jgi:hypothetical protein
MRIAQLGGPGIAGRGWEDTEIWEHILSIFVKDAIWEVWEGGTGFAQAISDAVYRVVAHSGDDDESGRAPVPGELVIAEQAEHTGQIGAAQGIFREEQQAGCGVVSGEELAGEFDDMFGAEDIEPPAALAFLLELLCQGGDLSLAFCGTHQAVSRMDGNRISIRQTPWP